MLNVRYGTVLVKGQELSKANTKIQPAVSFKGTTGKLYTLILSDPDAPAADWLHWLVINNDGTTKQELVSYNPPQPPSGTHRYIFTLCEQPGKLQIEPPVERGNFDTQKFISDNRLKVVSKRYFTTSA
jgi:phosphatidylethanolamine-binding protein (PEBP) family uncharacterized protein